MRWPLLDEYSETLKIHGSLWTVRFVREIKGHPDCHGICRFVPSRGVREIYVKLGQSPRNRFKTWFHEILHAYEFETGRNLGERKVRMVEDWVAELLGDNF